MANRADIFVNFGNGERALNVKCVIIFDNFVTDFRFSLSKLLIIDSISTNTDSEWKIIKEWQPQWQYKSNEVEITSKTPMQKLNIEYHGNISGWCNIIEDKRIALSGYSAWTLSETSIPVKFLFKMENMEDYFVINARYDATEKLWIYGETDHDVGNIIALKKGYYHVAGTDNFNFYYLNEAEKAYADNYIYYYDDIMKYYSSVFGKRDIAKMDIVSLDIEKGGGAYFRRELLVREKTYISEDKEEIRKDSISLLGHELGHNWFTGADTTSWEDWLNETGAEWAALLYILSLGEKEFLEKHIIEMNENEHYLKTSIIKPLDLKRPAWGVHTRGVMMFYEIYGKYGAEIILKILQVLAGLKETGKEVTTDYFLSELRAKVNNDIPKLIERGLTMNDYAELFV